MLKYRKFLDLTDEEIIFIIKDIFPNTTKVDHIERDATWDRISCDIYIMPTYPHIPDTLTCTVDGIETHDFELDDDEILKWQQYLLAKGCDERLKDNPYLHDYVADAETQINEALQHAINVENGEGSRITEILNAEYCMGQFNVYMEMVEAIDMDKYVELGEKTKESRQKVLEVIDTIYR